MSSLPGIPLTLPRNFTNAALVDEKGVLTDGAQKIFNQLPATLGGKIAVRYDGAQKKRLGILASQFADGTQWNETDTGLTYASVGKNWKYHSGVMQVTSDALPTNLGVNDTDLLAEVTDYNHLLRWTGTGWEWGPGESGSGFIVIFLNPPAGVGWQACDGTTGVPWLHSDGTFTFPDMPTIAAIAGTAGYFFRQ